ncbi:MAG: hypothetical protein QOE44_1010, partial [Solirubrobacteraceae bacterium]|nr:hypothetical protein [Solirubrobacteraceae bacterium]
ALPRPTGPPPADRPSPAGLGLAAPTLPYQADRRPTRPSPADPA